MRASHACLVATLFAIGLGACALQTEATSQPDPKAKPSGAAQAAAQPAPAPAAPTTPTMEQDAQALFTSLTPEQRAKALLEFDDPKRNEVVFPGGVRAGIQIKELDATQQALAHKILGDFTSPTGLAQAEQIIHQAGPEGLQRYYLAFFGAPAAGKAHAWRIAEHHLTLVDVEINDATAVSVGPILLGSNPPEFFEAEENGLLDLYASLSPTEKALVDHPLPGVSGEPLVLATAIPVWKLSSASLAKLTAVVDQRLSFYSPDLQYRIAEILGERGGLLALHMSFYGDVAKRCKDGGKWDWKLGGPTFLLDYENSRGHIHTSLKASLQRPSDGR